MCHVEHIPTSLNDEPVQVVIVQAVVPRESIRIWPAVTVNILAGRQEDVGPHPVGIAVNPRGNVGALGDGLGTSAAVVEKAHARSNAVLVTDGGEITEDIDVVSGGIRRIVNAPAQASAGSVDVNGIVSKSSSIM